MRTQVLALATLAVLVAGCTSAGNSTSSGMSVAPPVPSQGSAAMIADNHKKNAADNAGINAVNALGSPVKTYDDASAGTASKQASGRIDHSKSGSCNNGVEVFVPDRAGTPNSTENLFFYDAACTQLSRDVVRVWTPGTTAGTESVDRTATNYAQGNSTTPTSVRTSTQSFSNGMFNKEGYAIVADGFDEETSSDLVVDGAKNVVSDTEQVMQPSTTNINSYCTDSAGYNSVGVPKLDESFGWQGGAFTGGTRTENSDGSTTWSATHAGSTEYGPAGTLGIATGTLNTACPITTPAYTLTGGTVKGTYTIPISITYLKGKVTSLTVINGQLANGDTLNVSSNPYTGNTNPFINGTVTSTASKTTIATFTLNSWGDGTLTITSNGTTFPIVDWNVAR